MHYIALSTNNEKYSRCPSASLDIRHSSKRQGHLLDSCARA